MAQAMARLTQRLAQPMMVPLQASSAEGRATTVFALIQQTNHAPVGYSLMSQLDVFLAKHLPENWGQCRRDCYDRQEFHTLKKRPVDSSDDVRQRIQSVQSPMRRSEKR